MSLNFIAARGQIYIEGRLSTRKWDDKDGHTRYTTEIIGDQMVLLSRADVQGNTTNPSGSSPEPSSDLPY